MNNRKKLGAVLRRHRELKQLSLRELQAKSGVHYRTIQSIEVGRGRLDAEQVARLTPVLGLEFAQEVARVSAPRGPKRARAVKR